MTKWQKDLVEYRLEKARRTLNDALILLEKGSLVSAINRLYYALFYAATAMLLTKQMSFAKHSATLSFFRKEFVKTGIISRELGDLYQTLYDNRQRGDYQDFVEFDPAQAQQWVDDAEKFLRFAEKWVCELE